MRSVDGHALPIDELKGTKPTEKIDLSNKKLGVASAIIIASCIKGNGSLKELRCGAHLHNVSGPAEHLIRAARPRRSLSENALCGVNRHGYGTYTAVGITALCEGLKGSAVTSLE